MMETEYISLEGASVIVTGAGRGIGRAEAVLAAARGARVCVVDIGAAVDGVQTQDDPAASTVAEIRAAGGEAIAVRASVAESAGIEAIVSQTVEAFGGIDVVINNAGNFAIHEVTEASAAVTQRFIDVHLHGSLELARQAWPFLLKSQAPRIVNTISAAAWGVPGMVPYGSAKGAVLGLTRNLAVAGADAGILVNAIAPGAATRMIDLTADSLPEGMVEHMKETMPAELIAPVAVFLASSACDFSGEVFASSGGGVARLVTVRTPGFRDAALTPELLRDNIAQVMDLNGSKPMTTTGWEPVGAAHTLIVEHES